MKGINTAGQALRKAIQHLWCWMAFRSKLRGIEPFVSSLARSYQHTHNGKIYPYSPKKRFKDKKPAG
jgi:hypothetical protein